MEYAALIVALLSLVVSWQASRLARESADLAKDCANKVISGFKLLTVMQKEFNSKSRTGGLSK